MRNKLFTAAPAPHPKPPSFTPELWSTEEAGGRSDMDKVVESDGAVPMEEEDACMSWDHHGQAYLVAQDVLD